MALTAFNEDMEIISKLSDLPNDTDGLTAAIVGRIELGRKGESFYEHLPVSIDHTSRTVMIGINGKLHIDITTRIAVAASTARTIVGIQQILVQFANTGEILSLTR